MLILKHLKQIGKLKKLNKWMSHELTASQKNRRFEVLSSLILQQQTISQSNCNMR